MTTTRPNCANCGRPIRLEDSWVEARPDLIFCSLICEENYYISKFGPKEETGKSFNFSCSNCGAELTEENSGDVLTFNGKDFYYCIHCSYDPKETEVPTTEAPVVGGLTAGGILWHTPQIKEETKGALPKGALRFNEGKTPYAYLPFDLLDGAARVMEYGGKKYGDPENYRKGYEDLRSPLSSLMRHVGLLQRAIATEDKDGSGGLLIDAESGHGHIHHVITSTLLLLHSLRLKGYKI